MLPVWASDERILGDVHGCALRYAVCCCVTSAGFLYSVYGAVGRRCLMYCTGIDFVCLVCFRIDWLPFITWDGRE